MTVQSQTSKAGPYAGAGTKGPFPVDFRFLEDGHLRVIKTDADGVEQTLVIGTDYSVSGAGNASGGAVTLTANLNTGYSLVVLRNVPATQLADYVEGDAFPAESHERALDKLTMITQQLTEEVSRAAKLPVTSAADAQQLTNNIMRLSNSADNIDTVAANVDAVVDASENMPAIIAAPDAAQSAAESSEGAQTAFLSFDKRYLGEKSEDPDTDNQGDPLLEGALYWSTASSAMRVYTGTAWDDVAKGVSFPYQVLSGDGEETEFTLNSAPGSLGSLEVFIAGVRQLPVTNYGLFGATLSFVSAPPAGTNNIFARWVTTQSVTTPAQGSVIASSVGEQFILPVIGAAPLLVKADPTTPCIVKTSATTLAIKAGTHIKIGNAYVSFPVQTAITMPALTRGEDYSVWVKPDGSIVALVDPYSSPAVAPVIGAVKIGGFHYGLVASGTTVAGGSFATTGAGMIWTQADVDNIAGVNAFSIWDLVYRPECDPRGMTRSDAGFWFDIYFCGTEHITNGTSRYNTDVASGTVLPKKPLIFGGNGTAKYTTLTWYDANEIALSHGKRLMSYQEFAAAAYGVTEGQSLGGAESTIPATLRQAGYTSKPGGEQMSGNLYTWGAAAHGVGGSAWVSGAGRGKTYGTPYGAVFGGHRVDAGSSGSRCSGWNNSAWDSLWSFGLRAACDHYQGGV